MTEDLNTISLRLSRQPYKSEMLSSALQSASVGHGRPSQQLIIR